MRKSKSLVAACACAALCALCVGLYLAEVGRSSERLREEAMARYGGDQVEVCVAARDLMAGDVVAAADIEAKPWLADLLPEDAQTQPSLVVGEEIGSPIYRGEVITARRLGRRAAALDIPEGLVAVSVPAGEVESVGGTLRAGMRPDVYATGPSGTKLLAERALVVDASASDSSLGASSSRWVTLAVPEDAVEELVRAAQSLDLYFALSNGATGSADDGGRMEVGHGSS